MFGTALRSEFYVILTQGLRQSNRGALVSPGWHEASRVPPCCAVPDASIMLASNVLAKREGAYCTSARWKDE